MTDGVTEQVRLLAGRYQVGALIGRGGMAEVHVGIDARLGRRVAIKLLKPSLANDPAFRTRFRQEAQAAARMAHPTIVRVFDAGEETVRDASGAELAGAVHRHGARRRPAAQGPHRARVRSSRRRPSGSSSGILTALEYSHRAGVVHRDIKPGNIMITSAGQVKVMDFGIARAISDSSATIAQTSAILGTAQYFSPEQAKGESVDARTDLYSTGVVLFEMLTGRPPFRGDTAVAVAYQHVSEAPVAPNVINPAVSPALDAVVLHALAKDRFERFQTAAEFRADLEIAGEGKVPDHAPGRDDFTATLFGVNPNSTAALRGDAAPARRGRGRGRSAHAEPPAGGLDLGRHRDHGGDRRRRAVLGRSTSRRPNLVGAGNAVEVPNVSGKTWDEARGASHRARPASRRRSRCPTTRSRRATSSTPTSHAGAEVAPGQAIEVRVSSGREKVTVPEPRLRDRGGREGERLDRRSVSSTVTEQPSTRRTSPPEWSSASGPAGRTDIVSTAVQVEQGSTVNLVVSNGLVQRARPRGPTDHRGAVDALGQCAPADRQGRRRTTAAPARRVSGQSLKGDVPQKSTVTLRYCAG